MTLVVDVIPGITLVEALWLAWQKRYGLLRTLAAGGLLLLALRLVLSGFWPPAILLCLALAGLAHAADLALRWAVPAEPGPR